MNTKTKSPFSAITQTLQRYVGRGFGIHAEHALTEDKGARQASNQNGLKRRDQRVNDAFRGWM